MHSNSRWTLLPQHDRRVFSSSCLFSAADSEFVTCIRLPPLPREPLTKAFRSFRGPLYDLGRRELQELQRFAEDRGFRAVAEQAGQIEQG